MALVLSELISDNYISFSFLFHFITLLFKIIFFTFSVVNAAMIYINPYMTSRIATSNWNLTLVLRPNIQRNAYEKPASNIIVPRLDILIRIEYNTYKVRYNPLPAMNLRSPKFLMTYFKLNSASTRMNARKLVI